MKGDSISYAYDQVGNLLASDDTAAGLGVSEFEYDAMDRLVEKTTVAGVVAYEYDLSGMKTRVTDPNSEATTHAYDEAGRLIRATVLDTPNRENYFHHDRSGLIERKVLAGDKVVSYYAYDVAGRLSSLVNRDDAAAVISSFVYQRNPNGAVTQVEHEDGEFTYYAYDALDRLTEERRVQNPTVYGFAYEYDAASNRVQKVDLVEDETTNYTVDARNLIQSEVTGADEIAYEYDQAQRMKRRASADEATVFTHNQRDLPTKVEFEVESGTPDPNQEFLYTGTGERAVMVSSSFGPTLLAYDGTRLLLEKFAGGGAFGKYRWAGGVPIETYDGEFSAMGTPVLDERGSVERQVGLTGRVIYDRFGVECANDLVGTTRTRFVSPVFLRLGTSEPLYLAQSGLYLANPNIFLFPCCTSRARRQDGAFGENVNDCGREDGGQPTQDEWLCPPWVINCQTPREMCVPIRIVVRAPATKMAGGTRTMARRQDFSGAELGRSEQQLWLGPIQFGDIPREQEPLGMPAMGFGFDVRVSLHPDTSDIRLCQYRQQVKGSIVENGVTRFAEADFIPDPRIGSNGDIVDYRGPTEWDNRPGRKFVWWHDQPGIGKFGAAGQLFPFRAPQQFGLDLTFMIVVVGTNRFQLSTEFRVAAQFANGLIAQGTNPVGPGELETIPVLKGGPEGPPAQAPSNDVPSPSSHNSRTTSRSG
ncbi:MAG: hypothetical protein M9894_20080 [Planctomycetes bacterium]|nr:hypothetical protein [Planctomycetota bacterium]